MDDTGTIWDRRITAYGRLFEAHARLAHILNAELEEKLQLPLQWYGVLLHVGRSDQGVRPMRELTEATAFTSGGVTRLVDRMERAGLVERRPCPGDRRVQFVGLTPAGVQMLDRATEVHIQGIQRHMIDRLESADLPELDRLLERLAASDKL